MRCSLSFSAFLDGPLSYLDDGFIFQKNLMAARVFKISFFKWNNCRWQLWNTAYGGMKYCGFTTMWSEICPYLRSKYFILRRQYFIAKLFHLPKANFIEKSVPCGTDFSGRSVDNGLIFQKTWQLCRFSKYTWMKYAALPHMK